MAKGKKKSAKTPLLIVVLVLLIIVFAGLCVFYFGLKHYLGKTNYVDDSEVTINYGLLTADEDDVEGFTEMETLVIGQNGKAQPLVCLELQRQLQFLLKK